MSKKITTKQLNDWFCTKGFDELERITGIEIWTEENAKDDYNKVLDEIRVIWNEMSYDEKKGHYDEIGVLY